MSTSRDCDVLVVGCGPVGATAAALLANAGLSILAVDRDPVHYPLPRAVATDDDALRIWQTVPGLEERILSGTISSPLVKYTGIGRKPFMVGDSQLAATPSGQPMLLLFHQPTLELELRSTLGQMDQAEVRLATELKSYTQDSDGVTATLEGPDGEYTVRAGWLLGCDGASSRVREAMGVGFAGKTSVHKWVVADVFTDEHPGRPEVEFYCDPTRPTVTMPMPGGRRRWEFMLMPGDDEDTIASPESIAKLVAADGWDLPYEVERAVVYTFHARIAERWRDGRAFLLGDSAHVTPPFIGQGLNSGVRDAGNIWWKIAAVENGAVGPEVLDTYEVERRDHVKAMVDMAMRLGGVIQTTSPRVARFRDAFLSRLLSLPGLKGYTERIGWKPASVIPRGWLQNGKRRIGSPVGLQIPAFELVNRGGERSSLDAALGTKWAVITDGKDPWELIDEAARQMLEQAGVEEIRLGSGWQDPDGSLTKWLKKKAKGGAVVIRPDRFVQGIWRR